MKDTPCRSTPVTEKLDEILSDNPIHYVGDNFIWKHGKVVVEEPECLRNDDAMVAIHALKNRLNQHIESESSL